MLCLKTLRKLAAPELLSRSMKASLGKVSVLIDLFCFIYIWLISSQGNIIVESAWKANGFLKVLKETLVSDFLNQWRIELLKRL